MGSAATSTVLADAADVLSDQLRAHLQRFAELVAPYAQEIEDQFLKKLRRFRLDSRQASALAAITPGAAARVLASGSPAAQFLEQVEYNGRRLAKLNLPPSDIVDALVEYDRLLVPKLRQLIPDEYVNFQWVREQLQFCVVLTLNNAFYQVREAEAQAFFELFRVELESRNLEEMLRSFLVTLSRFCRADAAHLFLLREGPTVWDPRASATGGEVEKDLPEPVRNSAYLRKALAKPVYIRGGEEREKRLLDSTWRRRFGSCWSIPLAARGRIEGVIQFGFSKSYEWLPREQALLAAAGERCLLAAEKARLMENLAAREEQVRILAEHMLHVEEMERRRISRELHDEAGQSLMCVRLQLELLEQQGARDGALDLTVRLRETRELTEKTILEIRRLIAALSPAVLEQLGLAAALRQLVARLRQLHPARIKLHVGRLPHLPQSTEIIVYRLAQECCNNIAKHSSASVVNISLLCVDGILTLVVEDNGVGFDVEEAFASRDSFGLSGMRERVTFLGGKFQVRSRRADKGTKGKPGTEIAIEFPLLQGDALDGAFVSQARA